MSVLDHSWAGKSVVPFTISPLSSIFGIMQCSWMWLNLHFALSLLSAAGILARSPPASLHIPPPPSTLPSPRVSVASSAGGGDSSSPILFRPDSALWKWQWLFILFPKLLRAPFHTPIFPCFLPVIFHSFLPSLVDVFLHSSQGITDTLICMSKVGISHHPRSYSAPPADSCSCWECWFAGGI